VSAGKVYATISGFVGHNGGTVRLSEGDEYDLTDELVTAHPDKFTTRAPETAGEAPKKRGGRRG
jgi:hypothetical protein